MRIFIYEYVCAQSPGFYLPPSVRAEGRAMRNAVVEDFRRIGGVDVTILEWVPGRDEASEFREKAAAADASFIIAPEFDRILESRCRWAKEIGGKSLGPSLEAVRIAADKYATYREWSRCGVPTPSTLLANELKINRRDRGGRNAENAEKALGDLREFLSGLRGKKGQATSILIKPRYGAGSIGIRIVNGSQPLPQTDEWIIQTLVPGQAASIAFLIGMSQTIALLPGYQTVSRDGRFAYQGGRLPLPPGLAERAIRLGRRAIDAVPGLRGYVGVDLVLGDAADGSEDFAIEINPRLTTSYVGLRALAKTNLAEAMLRVVLDDEPVIVEWRDGSVAFEPDGRVQSIAEPEA